MKSRLIIALASAALLAGCQTTAPEAPTRGIPPAETHSSLKAEVEKAVFPCLNDRRLDLMFDIGPSIAVGNGEKLALAKNAAERLIEDLAEYDLPVAIFTASPYSVPGGDAMPRPAAIARVIEGLRALERNNPRLERAIVAYARTYSCAPATRGALVLFTDGAWLSNEKVQKAAKSLTTHARAAGLFIVGLRPNPKEKEMLLSLIQAMRNERGDASAAYIEVDRLETDPDAFLLFSELLNRWIVNDTDEMTPEEDETKETAV